MNSAETIRHLKIAAQETRQSIVSHCEMEKERPFTLNDDYRLSIRDDLLKDFANTRRGRKNSPSKCLDFNFQSKARPITTSVEDIVTGVAKRMTTSADDDKLFQNLSARGHPIQSLEDLSRLDPPDEYQNELGLVAEVLSYFRVASKRTIDIIAMQIKNQYFRRCSVELRQSLVENLGLIGEAGLENCKKYATDDPAVQRRRNTISAQLKILADTTAILDRFP